MTHWKKLTNPDYLGAYALDEGQELILTISYVREETVTGPDGKKEDCTVIHFAEKVKPMILNVTNAKTITKIYETPYIENWAGKKIQIYVAQVKAFGDLVDALRIRPFIPKEDEYICDSCKKKIEGYGKLTPRDVAQSTLKKYGKQLCAECGAKAKAEAEKAETKTDALSEVIEE